MLQSIENQLSEFNSKLYNAGFYFRAVKNSTDFLLIESSFNLMYYVQIHIYFRNLYFTNIDDDELWNDAWYDDQLFLLKDDYRDRAIDLLQLKSIPETQHIFQFNVSNWTSHQSGLVIAEKLDIVYLNS